jgi:signal transduction histidine kinase/CheY-like chemotaxis protein
VIAWVGNVLFYGDASVNGESYVIALPLLKESPNLALVAFLGGFSAATAMVIVATITLSQMLSNDVILPLLVRRCKNKEQIVEYSRSLIIARRLTVLLVVMGAYVYQSILAENAALTSIGLIAFALVVQLAPAILFGLYWRKGNARGLYAGLIVGLGLWFYTLMIPLLVKAGIVNTAWVEQGLLGLSWLRPEYLLGLTFGDSFTRGVILSLGANILCYWWYSLTAIENFTDRIQAGAFTNMQKANYELYDDISMHDLYALLDEFLGVNLARSLFAEYQNNDQEQTHRSVVEKAQRALAGTVGVASAQALISSLRSGKKMAVEEVVNLFGETTKALRFNQEVLFSSFENISSGISVVDAELKMVAWNNRYETMFDYPDDLLKIGLHVADIMRFNGERGLLGKGNVDEHIRKRLSFMAVGKIYRVVRFHSDDTIIEIKGMPLPNGGYVTTYDDITDFIMAQRQLEDANQNLEKRVQERTQTIAEINHNLLEEIERRGHIENELRQAKKLADEASASKTKFLALAGHDIMQPLNAASLYASALSESDKANPALLLQLKRAIQNTESIISSLLEISKVDNGTISPKLTQFLLNDLLSNLISEAMAQRPRDLDIHYCYSSVSVISDKHCLRRILQNLISNAVKYTQSGKVLVGCRRRRSVSNEAEVEICILDNGPGISDQEQIIIFDEFYRSDRQQQSEHIPGIGLGLSVVKRFSDLLGHKITCRSELHCGSIFSIRVPLVNSEVQAPEQLDFTENPQYQLEGLNLLYVDDDPQNLLATSALLEHWHCSINVLDGIGAARAYVKENPPPAVLLMDYQLGDIKITGIDLATELLAEWGKRFEHAVVAVCIVSTANQEDLTTLVDNTGFEFLSKPIRPARLRALLAQFKERSQRE